MTSTQTSRGVAASVVASALFAVLFLLPAYVPELSSNEIFAWRAVVALPLLSVLFVFTGWGQIRAVSARLRRRPWLGLILLVQAALLAVQMWMFGWAPQTGHGLDLALGYLLLPLVLVVIGVLLHREKLSPLRIAAVTAAAAGVIAAFFLAGGAGSIATVLVAVGYPLYFTLRRRFALDGLGSVWHELAILFVAGVVWMFVSPPDAVRVGPPDLWVALVMGVVSATALVLYLVANRMLSFALFGLLSYLEPVLLVFVSVLLLGEALKVTDLAVYGPIALALVLLAVDSFRPARGAPV